MLPNILFRLADCEDPLPPPLSGAAALRSPVDRRGTHPQQGGDGTASVPADLQEKVGKALAGTRCTTPPANLLQCSWVTIGGCTHPGDKGCERAPAPGQRIGCLERPTYLFHELGTAKNP